MPSLATKSLAPNAPLIICSLLSKNRSDTAYLHFQTIRDMTAMIKILNNVGRQLASVGQYEKANFISNHTQVLVENFDENRIKKLVVQNVHSFKVIPLENTIYMQGEINYTRMFLANGDKIFTTKTLKEYDTLLTDYGFFRIHQLYFINLSFVAEYIKGDGGKIMMTNGAQLNLSSRRKQQFLT